MWNCTNNNSWDGGIWGSQSVSDLLGTQSESSISLLPFWIALPKTIGMDMVSVKPMSGQIIGQEERDRILAEVKLKNREGKIDSIIEGDFKEMNPQDHPDWKDGGMIFYLDYLYGPTSSGTTS